MELNLAESSKSIMLAFLLIILPLIFILIGLVINIVDILGGGWTSTYYILLITWFGSGLIFYSALR